MEAGERVGRRTDDHGGELHLFDGPRGDGGGYGTTVPGGEIPEYQNERCGEPCEHHQHPE